MLNMKNGLRRLVIVIITAKIVIISSSCLILIINSSLQTNNEDQTLGFITKIQAQEKNHHCDVINFHYLIVRNYMMTEKVRRIEVFLDVKSFSEENLKILFAYLSEKNPMPDHLTIIVHTDWSQILIPSDCPAMLISEQPDEPNRYDYHRAVFARRKKERVIEYFTYNPKLKTDEVKLVVIKGEVSK